MRKIIHNTFESGNGIFRMIPNFIPIKFGMPGRRLKIHPNDYYAFGLKAGTIMERWLCSVNGTRVKNPDNPSQGISYVLAEDGEKFTLKEAIVELGEELIGEELQKKYGTFPVFSKFFDYETPLYFHFHPKTEIAARVGCEAKPECYYFPPQFNNYKGKRASTYFGFNPGVTKEDVKRCIENFSDCDTKITNLSKAYDIEAGAGWYVPAGVLHAPGSLLTYEPQWGTDLNCVLENVVSGEIFDEKYLYDICPPEEENKVDYIMNAIDWDKNYDENFKEHYFRPPVELPKTQAGLTEKWICYGNDYITAKEVTVMPDAKVVLKDTAAYGCILIQGFGTFGLFDAESVNMMRVGEQTADEYFVCKRRAEKGVEIHNRSKTEPMVILQHFGPDNIVYPDKKTTN
ncbi:hypothetical protein DWX43_01090 [Clostridium sp. AF19-22AC]|jgi:hypothetical protein|uniref:hypothetical protein n=1 Tax=Clostridia TaxID=186801 RepID=UPI000E4AE8AB|nr:MULTISPECIES: hypothetical protein [Clostridia]RHR33043.1 hypothetical protein DWX43_01090 [Clostridium sp. AF19-22AC]